MNKKPTKKQATVPAWVCPNCGKSHPITVRECCRAPINPDANAPWVVPWRDERGPWPRITWTVPEVQWWVNQPYCGGGQ